MAYNLILDILNCRQVTMIPRLLYLPSSDSLFLFGPRGVGKTTLLRHLPWFHQTFYINLLQPEMESRLARKPAELAGIVKSLPPSVQHVIIDEVQKSPKLLDVVHDLITRVSDKHML